MARNVWQHTNVSVGVCPVFGCVQASFQGGHFSVGGGVGLAVAYPEATVAYTRSRSRRGTSQNDLLFANAPFPGRFKKFGWGFGYDLRRRRWTGSGGRGFGSFQGGAVATYTRGTGPSEGREQEATS